MKGVKTFTGEVTPDMLAWNYIRTLECFKWHDFREVPEEFAKEVREIIDRNSLMPEYRLTMSERYDYLFMKTKNHEFKKDLTKILEEREIKTKESKLPTHAKAMGWALNLRTNALDSTTYLVFQHGLHSCPAMQCF